MVAWTDRLRYGLVIGIGVLILAAVGFLFVHFYTDQSPSSNASSPAFVGRETCAKCHRKKVKQWKGTHHDLAMKQATPETVKANFDGSTFSDDGTTYTFFQENGSYRVRVEWKQEDQTKTYDIPYTFGVEPIQQYLLSFPDGRLQALTVVWNREKDEWMSLHPDRDIPKEDWLHWSERGQNWNSNCASCHTTNFRKEYDPETDSYDSSWSEGNVSCEACHGPGSEHVSWAKKHEEDSEQAYENSDLGLQVRFPDPAGTWKTGENGVPYRTKIKPTKQVQQTEMSTCGRCHARRSSLSKNYQHGDRFLDHFSPQLLEENLYYPDGKIKEEVYVYGSFRQSKMYQKGVRCSDCHEPHSLTLTKEGNNVCTQCHGEDQYDTPEHHHHPPDSSGSKCVTCHMPERTFMVVDERRDHRFHIPRPTLAASVGSPDACTQCHEDRSADWATGIISGWNGEQKPSDGHFATTFHDAWNGDRSAPSRLKELMLDQSKPAFLRASAVRTLQRYLNQEHLRDATPLLDAGDPLLRRTAVQLFSAASGSRKDDALVPLLDDPVRGVRHAAARALLGVSTLSDSEKRERDRIVNEIRNVLRSQSDNRGGQFSLAQFYEQKGNTSKAIEAYRRAIEMDRRYLDAYTSLARLYASEDQYEKAIEALKTARDLNKPARLSERMWHRAQGQVHFQLGQLYNEAQQRKQTVLSHFKKAVQHHPENDRFHYNLGLLYSQLGRVDPAVEELKRAMELNSEVPRYRYGLVRVLMAHGRNEEALRHAKELVEDHPNRQRFQRLYQRLRRRTRSR